MYHTTGLTIEQVTDLCALIDMDTTENEQTWPPILGLFNSVVVALTYLRRNRVQAELAETYAVSQPTISRAVTGVTPVLERVLRKFVPTADELDDRTQYLVDGTLLPCWSWADHPELYSGKHKTTGMNVQIACTLDGRLAWISDPIDGRRHDTYCLGESEVLVTLDPGNWVGDKGYVGNDMITPIKKPAGVIFWTGRRSSTLRSIGFAGSSSKSSPTSRPGASCTPITVARSQLSVRPFLL